MAELTLPAAELRRLRHAAIRIKSKTKVGGAGLTREVVEKIKEKWKTEEGVRVKVSTTPVLNMRLVGYHEKGSPKQQSKKSLRPHQSQSQGTTIGQTPAMSEATYSLPC